VKGVSRSDFFSLALATLLVFVEIEYGSRYVTHVNGAVIIDVRVSALPCPEIGLKWS
jgi:hypothetical protein